MPPGRRQTRMASVVAALYLFTLFGRIPVDASPPDVRYQWSADRKECGLAGTTRFRVVSGVPRIQPTERATSLEFAIAPIEGGTIVYEKAVFVRSDAEGEYRAVLPPGTYWVGPKAKAIDPSHYGSSATLFAENIAVVSEGQFTKVDVLEVGYAP